jgi:uncharacterized protein (TIGR03435 family)
MRRFGALIESRRKLWLSAAGLLAIAAPIVFGTANAAPSIALSQGQSQGQAQGQGPAPAAPAYEFDVATIKLSPGTAPLGGGLGFYSEDTFRSRNMQFRFVIRWAYGLWGGGGEMVLGGPSWLDSERYEIRAKMDPSVAEQMKKLSPDQRTHAQEQMVQALLADRLKLVIHREAKELPVYALTIAKDGSKLKKAKPGDTYDKATFPYADKFADAVKPGAIFGVGGGGPGGMTMTLYCFGVSMPALAKQLTIYAGQIVQDKTGLTGSYDFELKYGMTPMRPASEGAPGGQPVPEAAEPGGGPSLFKAIQQQLGLELKSGKGPVQIVVIDHVEKPTEN